jgi:hypothetical protein
MADGHVDQDGFTRVDFGDIALSPQPFDASLLGDWQGTPFELTVNFGELPEPPAVNFEIVGGIRTRRRARQMVDGRHEVKMRILERTPTAVRCEVAKIYRLKQRRRGRPS